MSCVITYVVVVVVVYSFDCYIVYVFVACMPALLFGCVCVVTYITTVCSTTFPLNADVAVDCDFVDFLETVPA